MRRRYLAVEGPAVVGPDDDIAIIVDVVYLPDYKVMVRNLDHVELRG